MRAKEKARKAAEAMIPLGFPDRQRLVDWCARGYMAGHAAHTRWANKHVEELRRGK